MFKWVSLAYILGSQIDRNFGRSLISMYNKNSSGPKIVPYGTPQLNDQHLESVPLVEHISPMLGSVFRFPHLITALFRFWFLPRFAGFLEFNLWFSVFVNNDGVTIFLVLPRKFTPRSRAKTNVIPRYHFIFPFF